MNQTTSGTVLAVVGSPSTQTAVAILACFCIALTMASLAGRIPQQHRTIRIGPASAYVNQRIGWLILGATLLLVGLILIGLMVGDFPISAWDSLKTALWDRDGEHSFIVNTLRFPRVLTAVLAGAALGASGMIFQSLIRNPLVSPDIIGINSGAAIFAVFILASGADVSLLPPAAFAGALGTALLIYLLSWKQGVNGTRLVLIGIGLNAVLGSGITYMQVRFPVERLRNAYLWQTGSLFGASWKDVRLLAIGLTILIPLAIMLTTRLRILQLGDDAAAGLGIRVERVRLALLAVGSGLAAVAVAVVGPLSFVALVVPHVARRIAGNVSSGVLVLTSLLGGVMLLGCDLAAQRLFAPTSLPAGIVTAALGGPYFLFLLFRHNEAA